ncbi:MAG: PorT family protein [Flavobacteriaceae bacterium]|nr:PorT family protein [Flavobacteriaceae bacterium]
MKKTLITMALALCGAATFAQSNNSFGLKGGLNYNGNGDYFDSAEQAYENPGRNVGYHLGIYGKIGESFYLRPELVYTSISSDYDDDTFKMSKLDLPVLLGAKLIGPVHVFAGPAFQYILDTDYRGVTINDVENDFTVGVNLGAGLDFGKLGVDLRYERGFSENEATFVNTNITELNGDRIDTRPDQLILSLSLAL